MKLNCEGCAAPGQFKAHTNLSYYEVNLQTNQRMQVSSI